MSEKAEKLYDGITGIRDDLVERSEQYVFRKRTLSYRGIVTVGSMAACAGLLLMITLPHLAGGGSSSDNAGAFATEGVKEETADRVDAPAQMVEDVEGKEQLSQEESGSMDALMCLFPSVMLDGYEAEEDAGVYEGAVLQAKYYNEELWDEMTIRIAHRDWFAEELGEVETGTVLYREKLETIGSYIYIDGGEYIVEYSFSTRDIVEMEDFYDMVYSAPFFEE